MKLARTFPQAGNRCPRCSFALTANTTTCESCGSFVPLEEASESGQFIRIIFGKRLNEMQPHEIAYYLACIPLVIGPPVATLLIAGVRIFQDRSRLHMAEWQKPVAIAALNILISIVIWRYVAHQLTDLVQDAVYWVRGLFDLKPWGFPRPTPV